MFFFGGVVSCEVLPSKAPASSAAMGGGASIGMMEAKKKLPRNKTAKMVISDLSDQAPGQVCDVVPSGEEETKRSRFLSAIEEMEEEETEGSSLSHRLKDDRTIPETAWGLHYSYDGFGRSMTADDPDGSCQ